MYAVIETGGKQYKVAKNDTILVDRLDAKEGGTIKIDKVLLAKDGASLHIGSPFLKGSEVVCEVLSHPRGDKVIAYKYKRRKSEKKKIGHRRDLTELKIKEIEIAK
jgi:large subunit ribosomal protein L21